jgi:hypothetical protein
MWIKMQHVATHGDGRLLFKRDIPKELRPVAGRTTWQKTLRAREWNATTARLYRQYMAESDRDLASWREQQGRNRFQNGFKAGHRRPVTERSGR